MGFRCGIVGLPNVGKSTLFNALTRAVIPAENYPFCTIEPNVGVVPVPDKRLDSLAKIVNPQKVLPATMEFVDIAGLVAGAANGEGLGNKFLANIRETDAIAHVVRCFEDGDVVHVDGSIDPVRDVEVINTELVLADLETVEKALARAAKQVKSGDKEVLMKKALFEGVQKKLTEGTPVRAMEFSDAEAKAIREIHLLTAKPTLYIANVSEEGFENNPHLDALTRLAEGENSEIVAVCAAIEAEISQLDEDEAGEFLVDMGLEEPGLNRVIRAGYKLLGLHTFFTAGEKEVRAWTIKKGCKAPQAAAVIHTDFEKGFIRAETVSYDDFLSAGGEQGAKEKGRWRLEGKDYVVKDGDVLHFRFNV